MASSLSTAYRSTSPSRTVPAAEVWDGGAFVLSAMPHPRVRTITCQRSLPEKINSLRDTSKPDWRTYVAGAVFGLGLVAGLFVANEQPATTNVVPASSAVISIG